MKPTTMHLNTSGDGATLDISLEYSNHTAATSSADDSISLRVPEVLFPSVKSAELSIESNKKIEPDIEINKMSNSDYVTIEIPLQGLRPSKLSISDVMENIEN
jgi:hypothetical protein